MNKFYLPHIKKISIYEYSLYECPLVIDFSSKLNIIYGTNGTGKSTLLMMLLFSIVGPYKGGIKTKVRKEQRRDNRPIYEESFFRDRTIDYSADAKIVSIFTIKNDEYEVTHSLVDGRLLSASINGILLIGKIVTYRTYENKYFKPQASNVLYENNEVKEYLIYNYQNMLKKSTSLPGGVNTLISMLLDVMFFDEGRNLTFWDSNLQETIIGKYIVDANFYENYCEQKLNSKALESSYKKSSETLNYMSKFFEKEKEEKKVSCDEYDKIELQIELNNLDNEINRLENSRSDDQILYERKNSELLIFFRKEEDLLEKISTLEDKWYSNLFPNQYDTYYKRFSNRMLDGVCPICGNVHEFNLKTEDCIMCKERLKLRETTNLVKIDIERKNIQNQLSQNKITIAQIKVEMESIKKRIDLYKRQISEKFLRKNQIEVHLNPDKNQSEDSDSRRLEKAKMERDKALALFNTSKSEEERMRKIIEDSLLENFNVFKSSFLNYATSFFGETHKEDLSLPFSDENSLDTLMIKFRLDGKDRDESYMLSESQRIFTDLAFRFSVLTTFHDQSFFICETPDSTLDMFHEEKAVKTFQVYINKGNSLILTANARRSSLISQLYGSYTAEEVNVVDLTQLSKLALDEQFSFSSYIGGLNDGSQQG
ncbi:MAG: AAA family ATPase [Lachnospiraceae bacterium]